MNYLFLCAWFVLGLFDMIDGDYSEALADLGCCIYLLTIILLREEIKKHERV